MTASMAGAPVASWRQGPLTRRFMLYQDTIARGHEVQPLMGVRAEVHPAGSGMRGMRFLTIIGPGFAWTQRSDVLHQGRCRKFAAKISHRGHGPLSGLTKATPPGNGNVRCGKPTACSPAADGRKQPQPCRTQKRPRAGAQRHQCGHRSPPSQRYGRIGLAARFAGQLPAAALLRGWPGATRVADPAAA